MFDKAKSIADRLVIAILGLNERMTKLEECAEYLENQSGTRRAPSIDRGYELEKYHV